MNGQDAEIEFLRQGVSCATLLEQLPPPWRLDRQESTRRALKYRRGAGEVLIVNHDERGWWDPLSAAKGDVFRLVQHLDPGLSFGQVCKVLRPFAGLALSYPEDLRVNRRDDCGLSPEQRWAARPKLRRGSAGWRYLTDTRRLPMAVLNAAVGADVVREGFFGSAWFAHRREARVVHVEARGPHFKGSLRGGSKALFELCGAGEGGHNRLALTEAPIDALSLAAIERIRDDTIYAATGGGMGPGTIEAIGRRLAAMARHPNATLAGATDANPAGERYAAQHAELAAAAGIPFARLTPTLGEDWNNVLMGRRT